LDEIIDLYQDIPRRKRDIIVQSKKVNIDAEFDTVAYWKQRAKDLEKLLEASVHREQLLMEKLQESLQNLEKQSSPVEELTQILKRADNFLHFVLQNAPVVIGHQVLGVKMMKTHLFFLPYGQFLAKRSDLLAISSFRIRI
jgi:hypothetical protein